MHLGTAASSWSQALAGEGEEKEPDHTNTPCSGVGVRDDPLAPGGVSSDARGILLKGYLCVPYFPVDKPGVVARAWL